MKLMIPLEEEKSDEYVAPVIPFNISSTSSHDSWSAKGRGVLSSGGDCDDTSVENDHLEQVVSDELRDASGPPPLPHFLQQERDDNPLPLKLGRDQSAGTAVSALTEENSAENSSPIRAGHTRTVSWDVNVLDTAVAVDGPSPKGATLESLSQNEILSLADLHTNSPLEAEAETSILRAIEEREDDPFVMGKSIFERIPESFTDSFRMAPSTESDILSRNNRSSTVTQRGHRRINTGATVRRSNANLKSTLFDLTAAMREMHEQSDDTGEIQEQGDVQQGTTLLNDANVLFRRSIRKEKSTQHLEGTAYSNESNDVDLESGGDGSPQDDSNEQKRKRQSFNSCLCCRQKRLCGKAAEEDWTTFSDFMRPRRASIMLHFKSILFGFILPALVVALILFHSFENPDLGTQGASISWLLLFLIRHSTLYVISKLLELLIIDFLAINTRWLVRALGPSVSLYLVQSRGFPFILSTWSLLGLMTLSGTNRFAKHWLYYQDAMPLFNANNPAGTITESSMNYAVLSCALVLGIMVTLKRVLLGLYFGRRTYSEYELIVEETGFEMFV